MTAELRRRGIAIKHKKVYRLMREMGLFRYVRVRRYNSHRGKVGEKAPNLLARDFVEKAPHKKWATDVTEFDLFDKKIFLSPIIDLYNGEIISYTISDSPRFSCVMDMLETAIEKLPDPHTLILHSDQGWHYRMRVYCDRLRQAGITQSMSRKSICLDNAAIEGFFGHLKAELLYNQTFDSVERFVASFMGTCNIITRIVFDLVLVIKLLLNTDWRQPNIMIFYVQCLGFSSRNWPPTRSSIKSTHTGELLIQDMTGKKF